MATISRFFKIKDTIITEVDKIIKTFLHNRRYDQNKTQSMCNSISDEVIKILTKKGKGIKFTCNTNILKSGK